MADDNGTMDLADTVPHAPVNLRVALEPYPHLRDDHGCVLARDYGNWPIVAFILAAVEEKIAREL